MSKNSTWPAQYLRARNAVTFKEMHDLEQKVVEEAIAEIARQGRAIHVTDSKEIYEHDLARISEIPYVPLLCDREGYLLDTESLEPYIQPSRRAAYEEMREKFLSSQ